MSNDAAHEIPEGLEEEYYQINAEILQSFNKLRPPLNIFQFLEDVGRIVPFYKLGDRLTKERSEELADLTGQGVIFVSRADHSVYVKHISFQLDLVLQDKHLNEREIADIFQMALTRRLAAFFEQPVKIVFDKVREDILVLTEYLWADPHRAKALAKRLHPLHTLANHAVNCGFMGMYLFIQNLPDDFTQGPQNRNVFDRTALGFFLHDLGMTKVPLFIRDKTKPLTTDEMQKIRMHTMAGIDMIGKLDAKFAEVERCVGEHHERLDGSGYPQKLAESSISDLGRLMAVIDSYCAMVTKRPYAMAMEPMAAARALHDDPKHYHTLFARQIVQFLAEQLR